MAFVAITGPFLLLMSLAAMLPTIEFDAIEYHLQGPKEYFQAGRIMFLPHNVYTSMPFNVEMLHLLGMVVLDDWWSGALAGQLLIAAHAPVAALLDRAHGKPSVRPGQDGLLQSSISRRRGSTGLACFLTLRDRFATITPRSLGGAPRLVRGRRSAPRSILGPRRPPCGRGDGLQVHSARSRRSSLSVSPLSLTLSAAARLSS